jgi:tRNA(fMet)-specific endonuclease VapC
VEDKICIDTDVLADFLRDKDYAVKWMDENKNKNLATTSINIFELYYGAQKYHNPQAATTSVDKLREMLKSLNLTDNSAKRAGKILADLEKGGNMIDIKDILIGSIALEGEYMLKTNNKKDFGRMKELKLSD